MRISMTKRALIGAALVMTAGSAPAKILVDQNLANMYGGYSVGGADWTSFTAALAAQSGGYVIGSVANAADLVGVDAVLVAPRSNYGPVTTLSAGEIANLNTLVAAGGRVALFGDGVEFIFGDFTNSIVAFASGGSATPTFFVSGTATAVAGFDLTDGVSSALMQGAATVNGGTALFSPNFATLWGDKVLTVLDVNAMTTFAAPAFRDNVAGWLGEAKIAAVPEPATWAMMIMGLALVGSTLRRRVTAVTYA